jgi:hypothetical protein
MFTSIYTPTADTICLIGQVFSKSIPSSLGGLSGHHSCLNIDHHHIELVLVVLVRTCLQENRSYKRQYNLQNRANCLCRLEDDCFLMKRSRCRALLYTSSAEHRTEALGSSTAMTIRLKNQFRERSPSDRNS